MATQAELERKLVVEIHADKKLEEDKKEKIVKKQIDEFEFKNLKGNWNELDGPVESNTNKDNLNTSEQKKELTSEQIAMQNEASQYHQKAETGVLGKPDNIEKNQSKAQQETIGISDDEEKKAAIEKTAEATISPEKNNSADTQLSQPQIEMRQAASEFHAEVEAGTLGKSKEASQEREEGREQEHESARQKHHEHEEEALTQ